MIGLQQKNEALDQFHKVNPLQSQNDFQTIKLSCVEHLSNLLTNS